MNKEKRNMKMSKETFEELLSIYTGFDSDMGAWFNIDDAVKCALEMSETKNEKQLAEKDAEIVKWKVSAIKSDVEDIKAIETLTAKLQTKDALIKELTKANTPSRVMELLVKPLENENKALRDKIKELEKEVLRIRWKNENN